MNAAKVLEDLKRRFPNEPEYHQAVEEVLSTIEEEYNKHPEFDKANLIERLCIPDRVYQFRVTWVDDKGNVVVQNNSACIAAASARVARSIVNYVTGARKRSQQRDNLKNEEQRAQWDRFQITQRIR